MTRNIELRKPDWLNAVAKKKWRAIKNPNHMVVEQMWKT
jgi:phage terminase small subunit